MSRRQTPVGAFLSLKKDNPEMRLLLHLWSLASTIRELKCCVCDCRDEEEEAWRLNLNLISEQWSSLYGVSLAGDVMMIAGTGFRRRHR